MAINLLSLTCYEMYPLLYKPVELQKLTSFLRNLSEYFEFCELCAELTIFLVILTVGGGWVKGLLREALLPGLWAR